jgi:hypothetical protein
MDASKATGNMSNWDGLEIGTYKFPGKITTVTLGGLLEAEPDSQPVKPGNFAAIPSSEVGIAGTNSSNDVFGAAGYRKR